MSDAIIPGLKRHPVRPTGTSGKTRWYLLINLALLTDNVVHGEAAGGGTTRDEWTTDDLARLVFGPAIWETLSEDAKADNVDALLDYLQHDEHNKNPFEHARTEDGFKSRSLHPPNDGLVPTLLWLPESMSRFKDLKKRKQIEKFAGRYREMVADRTYRMHYPDTDFHVALQGFRGSHIKRVVEKNVELENQLSALREGVERLEFLHQVVCAMLDFVAPPAERKRQWNTTPPYVTSPLAYQERFVAPPSPRLRANARSLRDGILPKLINEVTAALEWRMRGEFSDGHPGYADLRIAEERNQEALVLLEEVRTNEIIQLLLDEYEYVIPTTRNLLEQVLAEAFAQIATAPPALQQLLDSELMALARISVTGDFEADKCVTRGDDDRALLKEVTSFVPQNELLESANDFTSRLARLRDTSDLAVGVSPLIYRLLTVGSPYLFPKLRKMGLDRAYAVHLFVKAFHGDPTNEVMKGIGDKVAQHYLDFVLNKDPQQLNRFLDDVLKKTKRLRVMGSAAWSGMKFLLTATSLGIAFAETRGADSEAKKAAQSLAVATEALKTVQGASDFLGKTLEVAPFIQGRLRNGHEFYEKMTTVSSKVAGESLSMLDPVIGVFEFTSAALAYGDANRAYRKAKKGKRGSTSEEVDRDLARGAAIMTAAGVATSLASLALLSPMPLAGLALLLAGLALDKDVYKYFQGELPGPGRLAQDTYKFLTGTEFEDAIQYAPNKAKLKQQLGLLHEFVHEDVTADESAFWAISPGEPVKSIAIDIMNSQYGLSEKVAVELARK